EVFWESGYHSPATVDPERAAAIAQWAAQRRDVIQEWTQLIVDPPVEAAGRALIAASPPRLTARVPPRPLGQRTAAQRALFYRRALAAWAFLVAVKEEAALRELERLIELENTPLPPPR